MAPREIGSLSFTSVYPLYVAKAERKGRTRQEVDEVIRWLTGYSQEDLVRHATAAIDFRAFFDGAPALNPDRERIRGVVCGVRVEEVQDPIARLVRQLDKLIDELAKGRPLEKVLRR